MKKILLALILLSSSPSWATDWRETGISGGGNLKQIYLNYDSFTPTQKGTYEAWSKWLFNLNNPKSLTETNYAIYKHEFDCDKLKIKVLRFALFNQDGEPSDNLDLSYSSFNEPIPVTVAETLTEYVCKLAKEAEGIK